MVIFILPRQLLVGAVISMCAPHRIASCVCEVRPLVIKIQMVVTCVVLSCECEVGKDFLFFPALAFYTQFDTHRRGGNLQAYVPPNKIIYLILKVAYVLAICAVGNYW
ncbi:MAG TPA: hypothetical protein DCF44_08075 [Chitinophagaceae bacterium]|nr:hypothetical protein [Chitinophagaceae bacterium]